MKKLKNKNFNKARSFLFTKGRPLEQELFKFYFEGGESKAALAQLVKYQNDDGGFGNALEPDLRTPLSSALASSVALREMAKIGVSSENKVLKKTVSYFLETLDRKNWRWVIAPEGRKNSPHAPWWGAEDIVATFRGCIANPSAEITGLLLEYKELIPENVLTLLIDRVKSYLAEATREKGSFEMHDLICYLALYSSKNLDDSIKSEFKPALISAADRIISKDKEKWDEYVARPLWLCDSSQSVLYPYFKDSVFDNLDYEVESQYEDGSWSPFWDWGEYNQKDWPLAKKEWSSHLTLKNLLILRGFDRIEIS